MLFADDGIQLGKANKFTLWKSWLFPLYFHSNIFHFSLTSKFSYSLQLNEVKIYSFGDFTSDSGRNRMSSGPKPDN